MYANAIAILGRNQQPKVNYSKLTKAKFNSHSVFLNTFIDHIDRFHVTSSKF